jgi:hypothetical protein
MARSESRTKCSIWDDDDFCKLSMRAQRTYWMLYSQATISLCGVVAVTLKKWARKARDSDTDTVTVDIQELEDNGYVLVDWDEEELLVRTFARHDGVARSPKTLESARGQLATVSSPSLREVAEMELERAASEIQIKKALSDTPCDSPPDGVSDAVSDGLSEGVSDRSCGRAPAVSVSSLQSPSPSPSPVSVEGGDLLLRNDDETGLRPTAVGLAHRLARACKAANPDIARVEAVNVIQWAIRYVDITLIEEAIAWAEQLDTGREINLPRGVASTVLRKARDRNISMPEFDPRKFT